jgi:hypothetical protein
MGLRIEIQSPQLNLNQKQIYNNTLVCLQIKMRR